jgi:tRNA(fMet)-specific endonuclease VapC
MYILDTDHIGLLQRQRGPEYDRRSKKLATIPATDIYVTIISFHEQISGWTKYIKGTRDQTRIVAGYLRLEKILSDFAVSQVLPYSPAASDIFEEIKRQRIRIATMDLRIASIAIAQRMILVTRNTVDFERIPNLELQDWTI